MNYYSKVTIALTSLLTMGLSSCIEDRDLSVPKAETYSEVTLSVGGECSITETPMRSSIENIKGIYGIAISQLVKDAGGRSQAKPYAYGIFDDVSNLKINLLDGYKYRVSCTMVKDGKDSIATKNDAYGRPFTLDKEGKVYGVIGNKFLVADQVDGSQIFLFDTDNSKIETKKQNKDTTRPFIERYHGVIDSLETKTVGNEIELYRRYFAVKFVVKGLQADNRLEIQLDDSQKWTLTPEKNETEYTFVSFKTLTSRVSTNVSLAESSRLKVELFKGNESKGLIKDTSYSFKRNYRSIITLSDIDYCGTDANISVSIKDTEELNNDIETDLPWQGGGKQ